MIDPSKNQVVVHSFHSGEIPHRLPGQPLGVRVPVGLTYRAQNPENPFKRKSGGIETRDCSSGIISSLVLLVSAACVFGTCGKLPSIINIAPIPNFASTFNTSNLGLLTLSHDSHLPQFFLEFSTCAQLILVPR